MSITEYERHQLFTWFEEHMGKERATAMMNLVPSVGWGEVATSRDLELHRAATKLQMEQFRAAVRHDLDELRYEMHQEFKAVRGEMHEEFKAVRGEMHQEFKAVRGEMQQEFKAVRGEIAALGRTFAGWLFLSQAAVISAVAALLAIN